jgi:ATP-binding cassette subfamily G (WHITE) protein 1
MAYYSQKDSLTGQLTVEESLLYASKLKNCRKQTRINKPLLTDSNSDNCVVSFPDENVKLKLLNDKYYHQIIVQKLLEGLHLESCAKTEVSNCSGGQRRRLSIALELIFSPSILLLDEPTSGLDSLSTLQCVTLLKNLAKNSDNPMVIAASIHQPTARILSYFDNLYIVSFNGQCIYNGPTSQLLDELSKFNLQCPQYHNPADFVIEVASGDYGLETIESLAKHYKSICEYQTRSKDKTIKMSKIVQKTQQHLFVKQVLTTWILTKRCFLITIRDPKLYILRLFSVLLTIGLIYLLYLDNKIGKNDGCLKKPNAQMLKSLQNFDIFDPENSTYPNFGFIFYSVIFIVFLSVLPTLLSFPLEVSVFMKEHFNGWYSLCSFFLAKCIADIPPNFIFPIIYCIGSYLITSQILEIWRFITYIFVMILLSFLTQGFGLLVSAYFVNNITAATVIGATVNIPLFLFTGLLIKIKSMPAFFQPLTYISYFRLAFECLMAIIYGFNRCPQLEPISFKDLKEEFGTDIIPMLQCIDDYDSSIVDNATLALKVYNEMIEKNNPSYALQSFDYFDNVLYFDIGIMIIYTIVLRVLAYGVLVWRTSIK